MDLYVRPASTGAGAERLLTDLGRHQLPSAIALRGVVVAAHPDDEVIGVGARLSRWADVRVVHVTDGAPRDMRDAAALGIVRREEYAALRRAERRRALQIAAIGDDRIHDLDYPDNETSTELVGLTRELCVLFGATTPDIVITHPYEGGHPDHDSTAFAVHAAVRWLVAEQRPAPAIVEMTSYHLRAGDIETGCFLPSDDVTTFHTRLDDGARALKRWMLDCYESQRRVLSQFRCDLEPVRIAPRYDFEAPPHPGRLFYEHFAWCESGAEWRARAREAARVLGLRAQPELVS